MKRASRSLILLMLTVMIPTLWGHSAEPTKVSDLMQKKLKHSQKLLEGLAVNDFDSLARNADELIQVSKEVEWKVMKTPQYELYSDEFRQHAETLHDKAKAKNLDGAALAYVELTLTCVRCHKHVREVRMTQREPRDKEDRTDLPLAGP
jgi:hypothetical protein